MKRKYIRLLIGVSMVILAIICSDHSIKAEYSAANGINVEYHTQEEIREFIRVNKAKAEDAVTYSINPSISGNYLAGEVSSTSLNSAAKMLNQIRFIAGISHNVTLNDECTRKAQAVALLSSINGYFTRYLPRKPADMDEALYNLAAEAVSHTLVSQGLPTINKALLLWADSINSTTLGTRRIILNQEMVSAGLGMVNDFQIMDFEGGYTTSPYDVVVWPAQTMPLDYFDVENFWSISMYLVDVVYPVEITLTKISDNRVWYFSSGAAGGLRIDDLPYGDMDSLCIIFKPENIEEFKDGDEFRVEVINNHISYTVTFFELNPIDSISLNKDSLSMRINKYYNLNAKILPSEASDNKLIWTSSDETVVTVTDGKLYAKGYGVATITVTCQDKSATCKVTVSPEQVRIIGVSSTALNQMVVSWKTDSFVTGYEIVYSPDKKYNSDVVTEKVLNSSFSNKAFNNLIPGSVYYVKMRSYKTSNRETVYGKFSSVKKITIKKSLIKQ